jgi:hypothetical protein
MQHSNRSKRKVSMASHAPKLQPVPDPDRSVAVIRFRAGHEDDGFGVLIDSGAQFHSGDDDTFTVRPEQLALLAQKGIPFEYVSRG